MASTPAGGGPVHDVLASFLPAPVLSGRYPFEASLLIQEMSDSTVESLITELDALSGRLVSSARSRLGEGEVPGYVAPGMGLSRRIAHAGLFTDHVLVPAPGLPRWWPGGGPVDVVRAARERTGRPLVPPPRDDAAGEWSVDEMLDQIQVEIDRDIEAAAPFARQSLRPTAEQLLEYWWTISDAVGEGWIRVVGRGPFNTDNIRGLCYHEEFRHGVEEALANYGNGDAPLDVPTRWGSMLTANGRSWQALFMAQELAAEFGRTHVITLPGDRLTAELISLSHRFFSRIPLGGALIGIVEPETRLQVAGGGEVERGAWFDQVLLGLGPAINLLDLQTVAELRQAGTAAALQDFIDNYLGRIAFAESRGGSMQEAIAEAQHRLGVIAAAADQRINATSSALTRSRLRNAGIWGFNGLFVGGLGGGVLAGNSVTVATIVLAAVGFALSVLAGALSPSGAPIAGPEPVIFELMSHLRTKT